MSHLIAELNELGAIRPIVTEADYIHAVLQVSALEAIIRNRSQFNTFGYYLYTGPEHTFEDTMAAFRKRSRERFPI